MPIARFDPTSAIAVIDIGSNSVRLVVYSGMSRIPDSVFNEKILCRLGEVVGQTGRIEGPAMESALASLKRFKSLCDRMGVEDIRPIATAAVREAVNADDFVEIVEKECGFVVRVLSGEEEARFAALGVLSCHPKAKGFVADLGGGSLEIAEITPKGPGKMTSMPLGPLKLAAEYGEDTLAIKSAVKEALTALDWLSDRAGQSLYLVGGAWRTLGRMLMRDRAVPLPVLQGYAVSRTDLRDYVKRIEPLSPKNLPYQDLIANRRQDIIPMAAMILRLLMKASKPDSISFAPYGLREGYLFGSLNEAIRQQDPFLDSCRAIGRERNRFYDPQDRLYTWTRPLFATSMISKDKARLHEAACLLSDIAWRGHPDFRAEKAVETILHGHFIGVTHAERAFVAVALSQAYGAPPQNAEMAPMMSLLPMADIFEARVLGAALRLAQRLTGGVSDALEGANLSLIDGPPALLRLYLLPEDRDLNSAVVERRLQTLAQLLGASAEVVFS